MKMKHLYTRKGENLKRRLGKKCVFRWIENPKGRSRQKLGIKVYDYFPLDHPSTYNQLYYQHQVQMVQINSIIFFQLQVIRCLKTQGKQQSSNSMGSFLHSCFSLFATLYPFFSFYNDFLLLGFLSSGIKLPAYRQNFRIMQLNIFQNSKLFLLSLFCLQKRPMIILNEHMHLNMITVYKYMHENRISTYERLQESG